MTRLRVKNIIALIMALALLTLAVGLTLALGPGLVAKSAAWAGLLVLLSLESGSTALRRTLRFARIGLLCNVLALLVLTLGQWLLLSRGWYQNPQVMGLFSQLQWWLNTVPTLVNEYCGGGAIFPEHQLLFFLAADYGNLLLQIVAVTLTLSLLRVLARRVRQTSGPR